MSLFRRSRQSQPAAEPSKPIEDPRPSPARLYSDYVRARPANTRPIDSAERAMSRAMFIDPLPESIRHKLVILIEQCQPMVPIPGSRFKAPAQEMANIAIERMVAVRGDLSLRSHRPHPQMLPRPFEDLTRYVIEGDCPLALDAVGAWADTYARLPGLDWLRDEEAQFISSLDEILSETIFAVRGREVILREDLGASVLVDKPLAALITSDPALRGVDDKLREALAELDAGKAADAVTDAGTALQMLLEHLGYSGGQLGDQLKAARKAGWLTGTDTPLADAIDSLGRWIASIRNQHGDAHHGPAPDRRDAELAVRIVGLLVLRFGK